MSCLLYGDEIFDVDHKRVIGEDEGLWTRAIAAQFLIQPSRGPSLCESQENGDDWYKNG